ncbi:SulP family inorganic anion transporter [Salibacterium halotolerans]|uniref:Sulfate permease, SulP family n=1 Tax=Salibacterium halotolerans TaxID=1884432 RepID=A0A1I5W0Y3_9BACI|nr:sulfate permease [Salibacterium halotolerans]SFQ13350.1 sulfate permease, SulP family [Salibacterium halotolerans]
MSKLPGGILNLPPDYDRQSVKQDITAGLTVFIMLVPQGMAYALLAGLPPVMGLYASTIPLLLYALFGSSRHLAVGPVALSSILIFSGVSAFAEPQSSNYITLVLLLTLMTGVLQLLLGLLNAGALVKFISQNVINGFTSAVAIIIGFSQLGNFFGVDMSSQNQILPLALSFVKNISDIHLPTTIIGLVSLAVLIGLRKRTRLPLPLLVVIVSIAIVYLFQLEGAGVKIVGEVPRGFPGFSVPALDSSAMVMLLPTALTIAFIAMMESLSITKTLAGKDSPPLDVNKELRTIGTANIVGPFFSSYAVTGSFSRSAVNYRAGAVSQVAMVITAAGIILTLFFLTPLFYYLPQAVLAAIILSAVAGLINVPSLRYAFRIKPVDGWVWVVTFAATLLTGIQWGLLIGVGVSLCILIHRISQPHIVEVGWDDITRNYRDVERFTGTERMPGKVLLRIDARIHFSNVTYIEKVVEKKVKKAEEKPEKLYDVIIDMGGVNDIDTAGIDELERLIRTYTIRGDINIWFVHLKGPVRDLLQRAGWEERFPDVMSDLTLDEFVKEKQTPNDYMI